MTTPEMDGSLPSAARLEPGQTLVFSFLEEPKEIEWLHRISGSKGHWYPKCRFRSCSYCKKGLADPYFKPVRIRQTFRGVVRRNTKKQATKDVLFAPPYLLKGAIESESRTTDWSRIISGNITVICGVSGGKYHMLLSDTFDKQGELTGKGPILREARPVANEKMKVFTFLIPTYDRKRKLYDEEVKTIVEHRLKHLFGSYSVLTNYPLKSPWKNENGKTEYDHSWRYEVGIDERKEIELKVLLADVRSHLGQNSIWLVHSGWGELIEAETQSTQLLVPA